MTRYRVAIISDDPFFIEGVRLAIRSASSYVVSDGGASLLDTTAADAPDVLLIDSHVEGILERCDLLKDDVPKLIFLSVPSDAWAVDALAAGGRGIIRRTDPMADVERAIAMVLKGDVWAPRHVVLDAWKRHRATAPVESRAASVERRLSLRERDVVRCVAAGMSNQELADRLGISTATAKAHLTNIFQKLGVHGRGALTAAYHGARHGTVLHHFVDRRSLTAPEQRLVEVLRRIRRLSS
jgi:NarL family two-component system response regulator YdfI